MKRPSKEFRDQAWGLLIVHARTSLEAGRASARDSDQGDEDEVLSVEYEDLCAYAIDVLLPRVERMRER